MIQRNMKKITCMILAFVMAMCIMPVQTFADVGVSTDEDSISIGNTFEEIDIDEEEPTNTAEVFEITDVAIKVDVVKKNGNKYTLQFTLYNEGFLPVYNWGISYEADYEIINSNEVEVVENTEVKSLASVNDEDAIEVADYKTFTITVFSNSFPGTELEYRLYGCFKDTDMESADEEYINSIYSAADFTTYDVSTGSTSLDIFSETVYESQTNTENYESDISSDSNGKADIEISGNGNELAESDNDSIDLNQIIGNSDSRKK
ncbi:MAG: hypothetical protein LUF92_00565 [Clostridiales bacterium]|nr:hypothetical protein [Clostridiales bacterium]